MVSAELLDSFVERASGIVGGVATQERVNLYCAGLKGKIRQVELTVFQLDGLCSPADPPIPEERQVYPKKEWIQFYCDAFWAFLYSSLDVLAQVIVQVRGIQVDEPHVSIMAVHEWLDANDQGSALAREVHNLVSSPAFVALDQYRNCCLHRRQIYIEQEFRTKGEHTDGYISTSAIKQSIWLIAENPLDVEPTTNEQRDIPAYLHQALAEISRHINTILQVYP